jgi:hypothetical protein
MNIRPIGHDHVDLVIVRHRVAISGDHNHWHITWATGAGTNALKIPSAQLPELETWTYTRTKQ